MAPYSRAMVKIMLCIRQQSYGNEEDVLTWCNWKFCLTRIKHSAHVTPILQQPNYCFTNNNAYGHLIPFYTFTQTLRSTITGLMMVTKITLTSVERTCFSVKTTKLWKVIPQCHQVKLHSSSNDFPVLLPASVGFFFFFFALMTVAQTVNHLKIMIPPGSKSHAERQMLNKQL